MLIEPGALLVPPALQVQERPHDLCQTEHVKRPAIAQPRLHQRRGVQDADGVTRPLTLDDVLVVAPYNAQVRCLRERLPTGARIGTVDKFQGQQAPVVFFSMTSSSGEDVPRGMDFMFSRKPAECGGAPDTRPRHLTLQRCFRPLGTAADHFCRVGVVVGDTVSTAVRVSSATEQAPKPSLEIVERAGELRMDASAANGA